MVDRSVEQNYSISVCIATYERSQLLKLALDALASQDRLPDEIIVSDSSSSGESQDVVQTFARAHTSLNVKWIKSERKALPWQRWLAFNHSSGDLVFFVDDDVRLTPSALEALEATYKSGDGKDALSPSIAGVGFIKALDREDQIAGTRSPLKERWLRKASFKSGAITPGGLSVPHFDYSGDVSCIEVDWLWGGAMSYRRDVLLKIGPLDNLYDLYDAGIGKGEDTVLSNQARQCGRLLLLTGRYALHPANESATRSAYSTGGYRRGVLDTWGRANTFRWLSTNISANRRAWVRHVVLVLAQSIKKLITSPLHANSWSYLAGWIYGVCYTFSNWKKIPASPKRCA
jgi:GT2 family glycosyltransferase